jgi:hypothetical protein
MLQRVCGERREMHTPSDSIKYGESLNKLRNCQLLKKDALQLR